MAKFGRGFVNVDELGAIIKKFGAESSDYGRKVWFDAAFFDDGDVKLSFYDKSSGEKIAFGKVIGSTVKNNGSTQSSNNETPW